VQPFGHTNGASNGVVTMLEVAHVVGPAVASGRVNQKAEPCPGALWTPTYP
jgi:hypothetical protein